MIMRIIFIRHAEPDYSIDSLTSRGVDEAYALNKRILKWDKDYDYYCSPQGRAILTCEIGLTDTDKEAEIMTWLKEFDVPVKDCNGTSRIPWDFMPACWTGDEKMLSFDKWMESDIMKTGDVASEYARVTSELDALLAKYGYVRDGRTYRVEEHSDKTIVLFCHMGITFMLLGHLLNISPVSLIHGMCMLPCSLTVLQTEERQPEIASFRTTVVGDITHLHEAGLTPSSMGYFGKVFNG